MGPRSDERGKGSAIAYVSRVTMASMGPRSDERGKYIGAIVGAVKLIASMGPRSDERGKLNSTAADFRRFSSLQWGRAPMSAESATRGHSDKRHLGASMGPRSDERGKGRIDDVREQALQRASMGPRSDERGKRQTADDAVGETTKLQWGRAPMSAERPRGHRAPPMRISSAASMGPRSDERGKDPGSHEASPRCAWHASMGPRSDERGKARSCGMNHCVGRQCFNGAALR